MGQPASPRCCRIFPAEDSAHSRYGKRSAEPFYGGVAVHPGHAVSSTHRSVQGLSLGYGYGHGFYGYGKRSAEPFYGGVAVHPGHAVSSTHRSAQGLSLGYGYGH